MAKGRKFGTFGGVYTPSVLTILGVIMYMRLSWIIGNAGTLFAGLIIILMAHIVSVTTGLSVSSVATDKKIKGGGIYYMLSRSLGFPIGGAIGITLFLATSFGISLYLIGFSESFLETTKDWFGIVEINTNHLRIAGSIVLLIVVTLAFISTNLAIKSQYIILSIIALSLVSVFLGTSEGKGFDMSAIPENADTISFVTLFGIFFPAVTGFTSGVAMSGDLRNPKKSIPWGTMMAIISGLVIYVVLSVFLYNRVPAAELKNNTNVIVEFSRIPQFVVAGIWSATLSSALGGILGAPRIFQAMSLDGIMPKFFAKGQGESKEPRRALIFTAVIAEAGILVGNLDSIAGIVTMFFMTAYLFINLSCFLEQWASPDFRPTFRIPLVVSLIGTIATALLMIQLDLASSLIAIVLMVVVFILLSRKQLVLGSGDVWQSVWSSVVKFGLKRLSGSKTHERNWEPNILLFSGTSNIRKFLLEMSRSIAGRNGMISNFDLVENPEAQTLFPKSEQSVDFDDREKDKSIFYRRQVCRNIYEGIETISQTYGFSGVEPNTVMLGWSHDQSNSEKFRHMADVLKKLDYNVLFLNYNKEKGFGRKKKIDIWWSDLSKVSYLTVQLTKLLLSSEDWGYAEIRFLYLNNYNAVQHAISRAMNNMAKELKESFKIEIINNELHKRPFYDVVKSESGEADLTIIDMPINTGEDDFVKDTDLLLKNLGTAIILRASSSFNKGEIVNIDLEKKFDDKNDEFTSERLIPLYQSSSEELNKNISIIDRAIIKANKQFVNSVFNNISKIYEKPGMSWLNNKTLDNKFYKSVSDIFNDLTGKYIDILYEEFVNALNNYFFEIEPVLGALPKRIKDARTIYFRRKAKALYKQDFISRLYYAVGSFGDMYVLLLNNINLAFNKWKGTANDKNESELFSLVAKSIKDSIGSGKSNTYKILGMAGRAYLNRLMCVSDISVKDVHKISLIDSSEAKEKSDIMALPLEIKDNFGYITNRIQLVFMLFGVKYNLIPEFYKVASSLKKSHYNVLKSIKNKIMDSGSLPSIEESGELENALAYLVSEINVDNILQGINRKIQVIVQAFPESDVVFTVNPDEHDIVKSMESKNVNLRKIVSYLMENDILRSFEILLREYFNDTQEQFNKLESTVKLLKIDAFVKNEKAEENFSGFDKTLKDSFKKFEDGLQRVVSDCSEILSDDNVIGNAEKLHGIIRMEISEKGLKKIGSGISKTVNDIESKLNDLYIKGLDSYNSNLYRTRLQGVLNENSRWRDVVDRVSVKTEGENGVPFFYQNLFVNNHNIESRPADNREYEWNRFNLAYNKFLTGPGGVFYVTGEPFSGKTYFIENIIKTKSFPAVFRLSSPGIFVSQPVFAFNMAVKQSAARQSISLDKFGNLPKGCVVIIDDLELWWSRTKYGQAQMEYLISRIKKFYRKYFFILSSGMPFYTYIRQVTDIDSLLSDTVFMQALKIEQVKKSIYDIHAKSGIIIVNDNDDKLSVRELSNIVKNITLITEGNIGFSYYTWLGLFRKYKYDKLCIGKPEKILLPKSGNKLWNNLLLQLVLHKQIQINTIYDLYDDIDKQKIRSELNSLKRTGVIEEKDINLYHINPSAMMLVVKYLRQLRSID